MTAMWDVNLLAATRTVEATMPFMLYRLGVCLGLALASLLAALAGAGTSIAFASFSAKPGSMAGLGAVLGLGAFAFIIYKFRAGLFFNLKAGHLALLAELFKGEKLPRDKAQIELAKQKAALRFPNPSLFLEVGGSIKRVMKAMTPKYCPFMNRLANKDLAAFLGAAAGWLVQTGDQALLALSFLDGQKNVWSSARDGLVLHRRYFETFSKNRLYLLAFEYLGLAAGFFAMLYLADSAAVLLPVDVGIWRYVFALIFAWALKASFFEPIASAALASLYFDLAKKEGGASETELKELESSFEDFRKIQERAV